MNLPGTLRTIRWMLRDTFRQSMATRLFWVMLAITMVCTLVCLSVEIRGDMPRTAHDFEVPAYITPEEAERIGAEKVAREGLRVLSGKMTLGFGLVTVDVARNREDSVRFIQVWLAAFLADTVGVLLALLWTAGFLPTFLEPQSATVLLAKPAPRWSILLGKYLGVVIFVALQATLFVGGTWLALGLRTGIWNGVYWLAVPLLIVNFAVFYSVSAFIAVATRSTVAAAFGTLMFWVLCWAMNYTHLRMVAFPWEGASALSMTLLDIGYWVLPKPLDLGGIFYDAMQAEQYSVKIPELSQVQEQGKFYPELSVLSSLLFAAATLGLATYEFKKTDY